MIPYLEGSYPWAYAHHYLRMERESLPDPVRFGEEPMTLDEAAQVVGWWCGMTGEPIDDAVRVLADAYLRRWGIQRSVAPVSASVAELDEGPESDQDLVAPIMTKATLLAKARRLGIAGRSNMSKTQLREAIRMREAAA